MAKVEVMVCDVCKCTIRPRALFRSLHDGCITSCEGYQYQSMPGTGGGIVHVCRDCCKIVYNASRLSTVVALDIDTLMIQDGWEKSPEDDNTWRKRRS